MLLGNDLASETTHVALGYLNELFVVAQSVAALASDLVRAVGR
jgi:hypothetical protein